jgi:murein DD-endopeptidase MepM/ murein hydrolase activator NlpD
MALLREPEAADPIDVIVPATNGRGVQRVRFEPRVSVPGEPPPVSEPAPPSPAAPPVLEGEPVAVLRARRLHLPIGTVQRGDLRSSFNDARSGARRHEAIDILAPRHTPIVAVEGGTIAKLFESKAGGITIYQFDPTSRFVYYYAHLERYAAGLAEGDRVRAGQLIGYVGTSGNAPPNTPHLHFAIFKLGDRKRWWEGTPIDPYEVLR